MVAATWQHVGKVGDIAPGVVVAREIGDRRLALVNRDGRLFALDAVCPHKMGNLAEGTLLLGELACPLHGFRYCLETGEAAVPRDVPGVRRYDVRIDGEDVYVALR
jgi:nitrite reductase/ring-hydroxylating ferredoxin subunit